MFFFFTAAVQSLACVYVLEKKGGNETVKISIVLLLVANSKMLWLVFHFEILEIILYIQCKIAFNT